MISFIAVHAKITWTLSNDGTLTISGTDMSDYAAGNAPWSSQRAKIKKVVIENGVTNIGADAFWDCSGLTSITIPNTVKEIREYAFNNCTALTSITIPNTLQIIGNFAFQYCSSLTSITIPNSVTKIGNNAFYKCKALSSITILSPVLILFGDNVFKECSNLTSVSIGTKDIPTGIFKDFYQITRVTLLDGVESIGAEAFMGCSAITSVTIPETVKTIGDHAFAGCKKLTSVKIPSSITSIADGVFASCGLTSVTIPNSVTSIGKSAFSCKSLTSITIPNSVKSIGDYAFSACRLSKLICCILSPPRINKNVFGNFSGTLYVPSSAISIYQTSKVWKDLKFIEVMIEPASISFPNKTEYMILGERKTMKATISPEDAMSKDITWYSSRPDIVSVSSEGVITAKEIGTAQITAYTCNGISASCNVTVKPESYVTLSDVTASLWVGKTKSIAVTVYGGILDEPPCKWSSSNTNVATVSSEGVITAKGKGTCTITCTVNDGYGTKATCEVTVKQQVTSIALSSSSATLSAGSTKTLTAKATPSTANNTAVKWSSSDANVATVSPEGVITAKGKGTCTITCTAADGYGTLSVCKVTVMQNETSIEELQQIEKDKLPVYNLKGQRINKSNIQKGVYIINGKKEVIK